MVVYIVMKGVPYEGYEVEEVFTSLETATGYIQLNYPEFEQTKGRLYEHSESGDTFFIEERVII